MANVSEQPLNTVNINRPKMLNPYWSRPEPKWQSSKVIPLHIGNARTILLPVERLSLTHYIAYVQHDKPVLLPIWVGRPQGPTMEVRVEEDGESECQIVMTWIGIESSDNIILHESEQTSIWSFNARSRCERLEKEEA